MPALQPYGEEVAEVEVPARCIPIEHVGIGHMALCDREPDIERSFDTDVD